MGWDPPKGDPQAPLLPKLTTLQVLTRALKAAATPGGPWPIYLGTGTGLDLSNIPSPKKGSGRAHHNQHFDREKTIFFHTDLLEEEVQV